MKRKFFRSVVSIAVTAILSAGCTHMVVDEPTSNASANDNIAPKLSQAAGVNMPTSMGDCTPSRDSENPNFYVNDDGQKSEAVRIRATGYGAPPKAFYPDPQRRLMAMRAAKIDAYRSLAERVKGVQIWGGTTIGDMVVEKDRFRVYLDVHLSGARVIAENPNEDGTVETVVEMKIGPDFLSGAGIKPASNKPCNEGSRAMPSATPAMPGKISGKNPQNTYIPARMNRERDMSDSAFYLSD